MRYMYQASETLGAMRKAVDTVQALHNANGDHVPVITTADVERIGIHMREIERRVNDAERFARHITETLRTATDWMSETYGDEPGALSDAGMCSDGQRMLKLACEMFDVPWAWTPRASADTLQAIRNVAAVAEEIASEALSLAQDLEDGEEVYLPDYMPSAYGIESAIDTAYSSARDDGLDTD